MARRGDDSAESDADIGHAPTRTPVAGVPVVAVPPPKPDPDESIARGDTLDSGNVGRPEADKLQRAVAKSRVAAKLFAKQAEQVKLGRYHLLEMVGAGGMGIVWGAWDPELDRRVAIKLVKAEMAAARDRILLEGKALGKLSHPNVVPVYDVGVVEDQIYLVMEWVRGKNLRAYCRQKRTVQEIVALYRAAGEGLSAAHAVGLIHRDFKPDNAMIGDDGRVRVLDFGLARGEVKAISQTDSSDSSDSTPRPSSELTRGAGTPRYMPPEQAEGNELTPAVDQYALGVSLREALVGRNADGKDADVPQWLNKIIMRATAREATNRFESMDALLYALSRDPRTIWRRRLIAAGAVGFAGAAFAIGTLRASGVEECGGGADEIAKAWNPSLGDKLVAHLTSLGPYGAEEAKRLVPDMTSYGRRWAETHKRVCMANERRELTAQLYDVRLGCLARAQVALQTVTEILGRSTKERLPDAILASRALPEVELCATETASSTIEPPPSALKAEVDALTKEVSRIRYLALAVEPTMQASATQIAERADKLGYLPLVGRARLALGFGVLGDGKGAKEAIPEFARARSAALRAGDLVTFVEAYAREVFAIGRSGVPSTTIDVDATRAFVEDLASSTKRDGQFARTLLLNNLGTQRLASGDIPGAKEYFTRALAGSELSDIELYAVVGNLAIVTDDPEKRRSLFQEEREHLERELGVNHPFTIRAANTRGHFLDNATDAAAELRDACNRLRRWHPESKKRIDTCAYELGWLAAERGDTSELKASMESVTLPDNQYRKIAQAYLQLLEGKTDDVARSMHAHGDELAKRPVWWDRFTAINAFLLAANAYEQQRQDPKAAALLERVLTMLDDPDLNKSASVYKRRWARTRAMLAKLLARTKPETAKSLANEALIWYRQAGGYEKTITALESI